MTTDHPFENFPPVFAGRLRVTRDDDEIALPGWGAVLPRMVSPEQLVWVPFEFLPDEPGPSPSQIAAAAGLLADETAIAEAMRDGLIAAIPTFREVFGDVNCLPELHTIAAAVVPLRIFIHEVGEAAALIGVELNCDWDPEHGLGILLRGTDLLGIDTADAAFSEWMVWAAAKGEHRFVYWNGSRP